MSHFLTKVFNRKNDVYSKDLLSEVSTLYKAQEECIVPIQQIFPQAKLLGGTVLSRCYLQHRISYDLDFFMPEKFSLKSITNALNRCGLDFTTDRTEIGLGKEASQWFGKIRGKESPYYVVDVSFVEDYFYDRISICTVPLLSTPFMVNTEPLEGIYYRKLVCIAGQEDQSGRQKARDVFDLYTLSKTRNLLDFMEETGISKERFMESLYNFNWFRMIDEYEKKLIVFPPYNKPPIEELQNYFDTIFSAEQIDEDICEEGNDEKTF